MDKNNQNHTNHQPLLKSFFYWLRNALGLRSDSLKQSVEEVIEEQEAAGGNINPEEKNMLRNVLGFSELTVEDIMVPRADIIALSHNVKIDEIKKLAIENAHTRLPVYRNSLDDIIGFVHIKDMTVSILSNSQFEMEKILRQILFVPPSMRVSTLLVKMQLSRVHIALVVDEYGGTTGLVTLEDLVEEIVGEIEDEHDTEEEILFKPLSGSMFEASGRLDISSLEKKIGMVITSDEEKAEFDTIGGLVLAILGRVPAIGEVAIHRSGVEFEVADADLRKVKRVIIRKPSPKYSDAA